MPLHGKVTYGDIHVPFDFLYANEAARLAATGFVADDQWKLALQEDTRTLWLLSAVSPPTWSNIGVGATGKPFHVAIYDNSGGISYADGNLLYTTVGALEGVLLVGVAGDVSDWQGRIGIYGAYDSYLPNSQVVENGVDFVPGANGSSSRGTGPEPLVVADGDLISRHGCSLYTGAIPEYKNGGSLHFFAQGVASSLGTRLVLRTKPDGSDTLVDALSINNLQRVLVNQSVDTGERLQVTGNVKFTGDLAVTGSVPPDPNAVHTTVAAEISALTLKSTPVAADLLLIEDSADGDAKKKITLGSALPIFGTQAQTEVSVGQSTTTSIAWQTKVTLTTPSIPAGVYRIGWSYEFGVTGGISDSFYGQVILDTTTVLCSHSQEIKDTTDVAGYSGFTYVTFGSSTTHEISTQYCSETSGISVMIQNARLEIWRVS